MPLNSTSVIKVVDLLCEGQIEGIVGGKKGIFLNETPVKSPNKKAANVPKKHFKFELRQGTRTQAQLKDYQIGGASNLTNISEEIGENYSETVNAKNKVTARNYGKGKKNNSNNRSTDNISRIFVHNSIIVLHCYGRCCKRSTF